ncbi:VOC family protein [Devosia naphthalenivorans]|uniref:VOC family protein n=1 Tax=Devosia naphthalenivorans TaxID=2082392 RepID=UPI000D399D60|nr:VOC family protein [Devosia naphthalenivorans]
MLKDKDSAAIVAVTDVAKARQFYEQTLGLQLIRGDEDVLEFATGKTSLVVYVSDFAGTNKANAVVWGVGEEIEQIVADLAAKGVTFEHYEGINLRGDIHHAGDFRMVWFKDPDGNILHINSAD